MLRIVAAVLVGSLAIHVSIAGADEWSSIPAPPSLHHHAAAWDSTGRRLVTFDGTAVHRLADGSRIWETVIPGGTAPPAIRDFAWTADPSGGRIFIFGGRSGSTHLDSTWVLSLGSAPRWDRPAAGALAPPARRDAALVHDPVGNRLVLHGGRASAEMSDTWALPLAAGAAWQPVATDTTPGPRADHVAAYDPEGRRVLVYGGVGNPIPVSRLYSDAWELVFEPAPRWTKLATAGSTPLGRSGAQGVFDAGDGRLLILGGRTELGETDEVLSLVVRPAPTWATALPSIPGATAPGRAAALDRREGRVLVSGGQGTETDLAVLALNPVPAWTESGDPFEPPAEVRDWAQAVLDSTGDRIVYFANSWVWEASLATDPPTWQRSWTSGTPPSSIASFVHDPARRRIITVPESVDDPVHFLDLATYQWSSARTTGAPFVPRQGRLAIDPARDRLLMVLSNTSSGDPIYLPIDVWELPLVSPLRWNRLLEPADPWFWAYGRVVADALYDPVADRLIVDGVAGTPDFCYCRHQPVTRALAASTLTWTEHHSAFPPQPPSGDDFRFDSRLARDPIAARLIVGDIASGGPEGGVLFRGWISGLASTLNWQPLTAVGAPRASGDNTIPGLAFDARRNRLVVFGMESLWFLRFDDPEPPPGLDCPDDRRWTPGGVDTLHYTLSNPRASVVTAEVRWSGSRSWAGLPEERLVTLAAGESRDVVLEIATPDTVSAGSNRIVASARWQDQPAQEVTCVSRLGDGSPPPPIVLVDLVVAPGFVHLTWQAPEMPLGVVRVERTEAGSDWATLGDARVLPPDRLDFEDHPVGRSGRFEYRLAWTEEGEARTSEPVVVDLPNPDLIVLACPPDTLWTPGAVQTLQYRIANPRLTRGALELAWTSDRAWEPFPVARVESLLVGESRVVSLPVAVPDSVAPGSNRIHVAARWSDEGATSASCRTRIGDGSAPPSIVFVGADATVERVRVAWYAPEPPEEDLFVERSAEGARWERLGTAVPAPGDRFEYEDRPAPGAGRWGYRLAWVIAGATNLTDVAFVDVPGRVLSVHTPVPAIVTTTIRVTYSLPAAGEAFLELVDVTGRRAGRMRVEASAPRAGEVDFAVERPLAGGVYALRLIQSGDVANTKVVVLR